ncbi:MAG: DUF2953 domain-containing protein [Clostridia bacterium]|nr:DUF2953 domain-containing protein [Clostridia bacterium]
MAVLAAIGYGLLGLLLFILFVLLLVLFTPLRARVRYIRSWQITVYLFGFLPIYRFRSDAPKKEKSEPESAAEEPEKPKDEAQKSKKKLSLREELQGLYEKDGVSGVIDFFKKLAALAAKTLKRVCRFITIRRLELGIRVGSEEADQTAINYGRVCAALFPSIALLSELLRIRKKQVLVQPDFTAGSSEARMHMIVWIWPFGVVWAGLCMLIGFVATRTVASQKARSAVSKRQSKT